MAGVLVSPLEAAIRVCCDDMGAGQADWRGFLPLTLLGLAVLLSALPPELTVGELAMEIERECQ
jgi:hypothetical protein